MSETFGALCPKRVEDENENEKKQLLSANG